MDRRPPRDKRGARGADASEDIPPFRALAELLPGVAIQGYDTEGTVQFWNRASEELYGYSAREAIGENLGDLIIPPEIRPLYESGLALAAKATASGEFLPAGEHQLLRKDGSRVPVYSKHMVICRKGKPHLLFCIDLDLSERNRARDALRRSEQRLHDFAELLPEIVAEINTTGRLTFVNLNALATTGYTREDLDRGLNALDMVLPEDWPRAEQDLRDAVEGRSSGPYEYTAVRKDGSRYAVQVYASPFEMDGAPAGVRLIVVDVTGQKRVEQALRESEERFRGIFAHSVVGMYRTTPDGRILMANDAVVKMLGFDSFDDLAKRDVERDGYVRREERAAFRRRIESEGKVIGFESTWKKKDGSPLHVRESARCVRDKDGRVLCYEGTVEDISDRRRAEAELRRQKDFCRTLIETSPAFFVAVAPNGTTLMMNQTMLRALGYSADEVTGKDYLTTFVPPEDRAKVARTFERLIRTGEPVSLENLVIAKDERRLLVEWHGRQVHGTDGKTEYFLGVGLDVTERRRIEEEFRHAQKMEAVGRLAAGIAHDFNNQLTVIQGYCDLLLRELPKSDPMYEPLQQVRRASRRAAALTSQLLAYSRRQVLRPERLNLSRLLKDLADPLARMIGEDVSLEIVPDEDLADVLADPAQVHQAIFNIATNARDAMPRGGRLRIETANVELDETYAAHHPDATPGRYVMLAVTDTGIGMDPDTLQHIFEPFFTTKADGMGTGLGLSTVYGFVRQSGGHVDADSAPARGTTVRLYLPAADQGPAAAR